MDFEQVGGDTLHVAHGSDAIDELIDSVPWARLALAYDVAVDAPGRLRALRDATLVSPSREPEGFDDWMFSSVVHQGTPYSATAPILWLARRILSPAPRHPALGTCLLAVAECATALHWAASQDWNVPDRPEPERSLPGQPPWACFVSEAVAPKKDDADRVDDAYFAASVADLGTLAACVTDWGETVVACLSEGRFVDEAVDAACAMVRVNPTPRLVALLRQIVGEWNDPSSRAAASYALTASDLADDAIADLMQSNHQDVRLGAALGRPDHAVALPTLVEAAADRPWLDATFPRGFFGPEPWLTSALIRSVLDRVEFSTAAPLLINGLVEQLSSLAYGPFGATYEWGPVLAWMFPSRWQSRAYIDVPAPATLGATQRLLLAALARNDDPWENGFGNASLVLGNVGLPHDRKVIRKLARGRIASRWWQPRRG